MLVKALVGRDVPSSSQGEKKYHTYSATQAEVDTDSYSDAVSSSNLGVRTTSVL